MAYQMFASAEFACGVAKVTVDRVPFLWGGIGDRDAAAIESCKDFICDRMIFSRNELSLVWVTTSKAQ